jgi:hypothetical protein
MEQTAVRDAPNPECLSADFFRAFVKLACAMHSDSMRSDSVASLHSFFVETLRAHRYAFRPDGGLWHFVVERIPTNVLQDLRAYQKILYKKMWSETMKQEGPILQNGVARELQRRSELNPVAPATGPTQKPRATTKASKRKQNDGASLSSAPESGDADEIVESEQSPPAAAAACASSPAEHTKKKSRRHASTNPSKNGGTASAERQVLAVKLVNRDDSTETMIYCGTQDAVDAVVRLAQLPGAKISYTVESQPMSAMK